MGRVLDNRYKIVLWEAFCWIGQTVFTKSFIRRTHWSDFRILEYHSMSFARNISKVGLLEQQKSDPLPAKVLCFYVFKILVF